MEALDYLQTKLTPLVNHDNQDEVSHFRQLCTRLCLSSENNACDGATGEKDGKGDPGATKKKKKALSPFKQPQSNHRLFLM
jgi:hypothetical protein